MAIHSVRTGHPVADIWAFALSSHISRSEFHKFEQSSGDQALFYTFCDLVFSGEASSLIPSQATADHTTGTSQTVRVR